MTNSKSNRGGKREGAGRPPVYGKTPLAPHLVRTLKDEWKGYKKASKARGSGLNTWIRETLNRGVDAELVPRAKSS